MHLNIKSKSNKLPVLANQPHPFYLPVDYIILSSESSVNKFSTNISNHERLGLNKFINQAKRISLIQLSSLCVCYWTTVLENDYY